MSEELKVVTEKASSFVDEEVVPDGVVVRHVYWPSDDKRRHTAFYVCNCQSSADSLVAALNRDAVGVGVGNPWK